MEFKALPVAKSTASGDADPRSSQILFLFEEFVPLEYRQQLTSGNKRKLVSLFTPTKSKQWKPAATLNGRPYVIGHVPRTATYGEVDFEGMLRGGNSSTKVLSLNKNGAVKTVTTGLPPPSLGAPQTSSPLTKQFTVVSGQRAGTPTQGARSDSPSTPLGAGAAGSPVAGRKSRFRLIPSVTSPNARKSVIPPSEYENVDFETRLASYSDDELNGDDAAATTSTSKSQRRQSKDDAWVDILVANHGRRLGDQEAELRVPRGRGLKGGRSDPELASMEVAAALAAVQGKVPADEDEGDDIEPVMMGGEPGYAHGGDTDYTPSVTDTGGAETAEYDTEDGAPASQQQQSRRMGYFDLHPERRPPTVASDDEDEDEEDPRGAIGRSSQETGEDDMTDYPPLSAGPAQSFAMSDDFEAVEQTSPGFPMPEYELNNGANAPSVPAKKESMLIPPITTTTASAPSVPAKAVSTKTAALIEMYRERERGGGGGGGAAAAPAIPAKSKDRDNSPSVTPPSLTKPAPPPADDNIHNKLDLPRPVVDFEPRSESPSRYVHGTPLHNVVEEPEEDVD